MPRKDRESSDEMSSLASQVLKMKPPHGVAGPSFRDDLLYVPLADYNSLLAKAQSLAGSVFSQDRTIGKRIKRKVKSLLGR